MLTKDILDITGNDTLKQLIIADRQYLLVMLEGINAFVWIDLEELTTLHGYDLPGFKSVRSAVKFLCEDYDLDDDDFEVVDSYRDVIIG
jgi:hypothetical protein